MRAFLILATTTSLLFFSNCADRPKDDFYQQKGIRKGHSDSFPLIKPYQAIRNNIINKWEIDFIISKASKYNKALPVELFYCDSLNVLDGIIIAKCGGKNCSYDQDKYEEIFFIISPDHKVEEIFFSYKDFLEVYNKYRNNREPIFLSADVINQNWQKENLLPWGK